MSKTITRKYIQRITKREGNTNIRQSGGGGGGGGGASQYWVEENYISKLFFNKLFTVYDEDGNIVEPNDTESVIASIKSMFGFWTDAYLSALGNGEGGGAELTLASLADVDVHGVANGQALVYDATTQKWVPGQGGGIDITAMWAALAQSGVQQIDASHLATALTGYATETWVGNQGYITGSALNGYATESWVGSQISDMATQTWVSGNYLSQTDADTTYLTQTNAAATYLTKTDAATTYVSIAFFERLFKAYNGSTVVHPNNTTSTIDNIKAMFGFWTDFYLSALGNGSGGSTPGVTMAQVWSALGNSTTEQINISHLTTALSGYNPTSNFKTINGNSIIGTGDIVVSGGGGDYLPLTGGTLSTPSMPTGANSILKITTAVQNDDWGMLLTLLSPGLRQSHHVVMEIGTYLSSKNTGVISFYNDGLSSNSNRIDFGFYGTSNYFSILASGKVGIGTTNPSSLLDVNGNIHSKTINIEDASQNPLRLHNVGSNEACYILFYSKNGQGVDTLRASAGYYNNFAFINTGIYRLGLTVSGNPEYWADVDGTTRYTLLHTGNISSASVASAATLTTPRTLWGQSFDGSANVDGTLTIRNGDFHLFVYDYNSVERGIFFREGYVSNDIYNLSILTYNHSGDVGSPDGISINGYDGVSFCTGSNNRQERMRVAENGNVGIGTTAPSYKLDVNGTVGATSFVKSGGTSAQFLKADGSVDANTYALASDLNNYLPLTGGTITAPSMVTTTGCLNVTSTSTGVDYSYIFTCLNSGQAANRHISIGFGKEFAVKNCAVLTYYHVGSGSTSNRFNIGLYGTADTLTVTAGEKVGILNTEPSYTLDVGGTIYASTSILSNGNIGIKTTSPECELDVRGSILINAFSSNESGIFLRSGFVTSSKYNISILSYDHNGSGNTPDGISINGYDGVSFCTGSNNRQERMRVAENGNVGIGTTSPSYKLHVAGTFYASGNSSIGGTFGVTGATTLSSTLGVSGATTLSSTLGVSGATTLSSSLSVTGNSTLTGYVGIGTAASSSYALKVSGVAYASTGFYSGGYVTALSDARHKDVKGDVGLTVSEVANAPSVKFLWKDRRQEGLQVGSIAQYWQKVMPEAIVKNADGELTMSYGVIALLASIATARKVEDHEQRIRELEEENKKLKQQLNAA